MIERVRFIELIEKMSLDKDDFLLTGSVWLAVMGIRDNKDIDIIANSRLKNAYEWYLSRLGEDERVEAKESIDLSSKHARKIAALAKVDVETLVKRYYVKIDGYKFVRFDLFLKYKKPRKNEKHKQDIKDIREFFASGKHKSEEYVDYFNISKVKKIL